MGRKRTTELTERQEVAWRLRAEGKSWNAIGAELGCKKSAARTAWLAAEKKMQVRRDRALVEGKEGESGGKDLRHVKNILEAAGIPTGMAIGLVRRTRARAGRGVEAAPLVTNEAKIGAFERIVAMALEFIDPYLLAQASGKDLMQIASTGIQNIQLLKGEPTSITSHEDRRTMQELKRAILEELERRQGLKAIDVTPEKVDVE